jgi:gas vesicle protein
MNDDEKGKRFLELIDDQNNFQWEIVAKLTSLISSDWNSEQLKNELKTLVENHSEITKELNSLDDKGSIL